MPTPTYRVPVRVARGTLAALTAGLSDLQEGELCYATDENILYVIEGGVLTATVADLSGVEVVNDTTPQLGGDLDVNSFQIISTAAGNIQIAPDTTGVLEVRGNTGNDAAIQLNCETNGHGVKIQSPPHSAAASYTLVLPDDTGTTGQILTTDGTGALSWADTISDVVSDTTPQLGGNLDVNGNYITSASGGNVEVAPDTTGDFVVRGNDTDGAIVLNCTANSHGVKIQSPPHSAAATYTLVLPDDTGTTGQSLTTDGAGVLSWATPSTVGSIDDLSDVDTSSVAPTDGQVLAWSASDSEWIPTTNDAGGATTLNDLTDVDTASVAPINGQALVWDSANSGWVPGTVTSGGSAGVALVGVTDSQQGVFNSATFNISFPGSPVEGDLAILEMMSRAGGDPNAAVPLSVPSGWTLRDSQEYLSGSSTVADITNTIIYKELDASDISAGTVAISNQTTDSDDDWFFQLAIFRNAFISSSSILSTTATGSLSVSGYDYTGVAAGVGGFNFVTATNVYAASVSSGVRVTPEPGVDLNWLNGSSNNDGYELNVVRRISSLLGTGTLAFNIKDLDSNGVVSSLTDGFHIMVVNVSPKNSSGGSGGGGGSSAARLTEAQTAASGIATFAGIGHSGTLVEVTSSLDAWIVLYDSASSRTADNGRAYNTDPASGSGILAEFYITAGTTVLATPGTTYFNNDTSVTEAVYAAVRDQAGSNVDSVVTITAYGNQSITSVSGGTFGSGV
jgi:hypothetical protein